MEENNENNDVAKLFEDIANKIKSAYDEQQSLYFELLNEISELGKYAKIGADNIYKMSMSDQITLLRAMIKMGRIQKELCEKYDLVDEEDE